MNEIAKIDKNKKIKQSNRLIEARYNLTTYEQKMMIAICSQLNPNAEEFNKVRVKVVDMANFCKFEPQKAYSLVKSTIMRLLTRTLQIKNPDGSWYVTHWLQSAKYIPSESVIEYKIDNELKPELLQLKSAYLSTPSEPLMEFSRDYSVRLYFILKKMLKLRVFEKDLDFFRDRFQLGKGYRLFANIKNKIIEPALAEINAKSDISVWHEYIKEGRSFTKIRFTVCLKSECENEIVAPEEIDCLPLSSISSENAAFADNFNNAPISDPVAQSHIVAVNDLSDEERLRYNKLLNLGVAPPSAVKNIVKNYSLDQIDRNVKYAEQQKLRGKNIVNMGAYVVKCIEADYYGDSDTAKSQGRKWEAKLRKKEFEEQEKEKAENNKKSIAKAKNMKKLREKFTEAELNKVLADISSQIQDIAELTEEQNSILQSYGLDIQHVLFYRVTGHYNKK